MGGWSRDAFIKDGMAVIDLTGSKVASSLERDLNIKTGNKEGDDAFAGTLKAAEKYKIKVGPFLSLKIKDFHAPEWNRDLWDVLVEEIRKLLDGGTDVLMACLGGHGRTGLAAAIVLYLLDEETFEGEDPILWLRRKYCEEVVESNEQIKYIYDTLGLPDNPKVQPAKTTYSKSPTQQSSFQTGTIGGGGNSSTPKKKSVLEHLWAEYVHKKGD